MGIRRITSDQRLAPLLGLGIALIAVATLVAYAAVGRQFGSSLRDPRSVERPSQRVTVAATVDPQPIVLPAADIETPAQKPEPITTETVELVAQVDTSSDGSTKSETFSGGIEGEVEPGLTDRIFGSIGEVVRRGKIAPTEGPDAPWGAPSSDTPNDPGSHSGGIQGDNIGSDSGHEGQTPADDGDGGVDEPGWSEPGDDAGDDPDPGENDFGCDKDCSDEPQDQGDSNVADADDQPSDQADCKEDDDEDNGWSDGDDEDNNWSDGDDEDNNWSDGDDEDNNWSGGDDESADDQDDWDDNDSGDSGSGSSAD